MTHLERAVNILVVGNGGREHALAWKLAASSSVNRVFCAPGNGGTANLGKCENVSLALDEFAEISRFVRSTQVDLVVVGPELPLALGITDALQADDILVFGPNRAGAKIESSKSWAKALMEAAQVPTAVAQTFTAAATARAYVQAQGVPIVIKADGLAAGKGVTVALTQAEAEAAIAAVFEGKFGSAGHKVMVEEYLTGEEISVLALTDGHTIRPLLAAQDHKRIGEGDTGANTGGMGAYCPVPWVTSELMARIQAEILEPVLQELQNRQIHYCGVLYAGLMITPTGEPKVIEFNCRFGDPETQAVLPLLATPLDQLLLACAQGRLADMEPLLWKPEVAACVVLAAGGYPEVYEKSKPITGIAAAEALGALVFHAGTRYQNNQLASNGGRVLAVTALGTNYDQAFERAYAAIDQIHFDQCYCRRDIGYRVRTFSASRQPTG
nr:phosphoribosylamine--glycine ligase [Petrachloros mirabilis]